VHVEDNRDAGYPGQRDAEGLTHERCARGRVEVNEVYAAARAEPRQQGESPACRKCLRRDRAVLIGRDRQESEIGG